MEGPRDDAACARGQQLQANELADEQAKKGSALHPSVAQVEQSCNARASFLGWLAMFLGPLHAHVKFRGWSDVAPRVQRQRRTLPGCGFHTAQRGCKGLSDGVAESCKAEAEYSGSSRMAETQKTDAGRRSQPGMKWAGRRWLRRKLDGLARCVS